MLNTIRFRYAVLLSVLLMGVALVSCSVQDVTGVDPSDLGHHPQASLGASMRDGMTTGKSIDESITLFNALPPGHKALVWKDKLEDSKRFFTDPGQLAWLDAARSSVTAATFTQAPVDETIYLNEAFARFTDLETYKIFMVLHDFDQNPNPYRPIAQGGTNPDCVCRWDMGCGLNGALCEKGGCTTRFGCGFLLLYDCTGLCDNSPF